ncbi:YkvR family protein [Terrilactibacillus laevilacticus]|uniref:YkvR family protein n=1 Tax=Terrilactibacillus laevilacticus TaxID=1380157 RepID=UPI00215A9B00|nr:YkvR family protein [Terrilactibacillus laevilacticus]
MLLIYRLFEHALNRTIKQYYTSITNLYEKGQVGEYSLILQEIKRPERGQK